MSNMSYCRFRNTLSDLKDCYNNMDEEEIKSDEEKEARSRLLELCARIAEDYEIEIEDYREKRYKPKPEKTG